MDDVDNGLLPFVVKLVLTVVGSLLNLMIVISNLLVIVCVFRYHHLRSVNVLLITSLAFADCSLGVFVLPFSIANEWRWVFGSVWCEFYKSLDVLLCTSSIYNLLAIGFDRYIAINFPMRYPLLLTKRRAKILIAFVWMFSLCVCSPALLLKAFDSDAVLTSNDSGKNESVHESLCTPKDYTPGFIVYSALCSFFIPLITMVVLYAKIYLVARNVGTQKNRKGQLGSSDANENVALNAMVEQSTNFAKPIKKEFKIKRKDKSDSKMRIHRGGGEGVAKNYSKTGLEATVVFNRSTKAGVHNPKHRGSIDEQMLNGAPVRHMHPSVTMKLSNSMGFRNGSVDTVRLSSVPKHDIQSCSRQSLNSTTIRACRSNRKSISNVAVQNPIHPKAIQKYLQSSKQSAEIRATKTVAIVTGCFVCSWIGFAVCYFIGALPGCGQEYCVPYKVFSVFFWLGYLNSVFNPFIYAFFSREFKTAFMKLFCIDGHQNIILGSCHR